MLQTKVYIGCKTLSNPTRILKNAFKYQKTRTPHLITQGGHKKIIKVITGVTKRIVMGHNNISLLFRYGNITDLGDQNRKKIEKGTSWLF